MRYTCSLYEFYQELRFVAHVLECGSLLHKGWKEVFRWLVAIASVELCVANNKTVLSTLVVQFLALLVNPHCGYLYHLLCRLSRRASARSRPPPSGAISFNRDPKKLKELLEMGGWWRGASEIVLIPGV